MGFVDRKQAMSSLASLYREFFYQMGIDPETGNLDPRHSETQKFACYPYIGSLYGLGKRQVLMVGLEVAHDNPLGEGIQSFKNRRRSIEEKPLEKHNPHIAGTYFTALKYGCPEFGWDRFADSHLSCEMLLKAGKDLPESNPLSFIALTNFHKWVTKGARKTAGTRDRVTFDRKLEEELLCREVEILRPDVVVFQSAEYAKPGSSGCEQWSNGVSGNVSSSTTPPIGSVTGDCRAAWSSQLNGLGIPLASGRVTADP